MTSSKIFPCNNINYSAKYLEKREESFVHIEFTLQTGIKFKSQGKYLAKLKATILEQALP